MAQTTLQAPSLLRRWWSSPMDALHAALTRGLNPTEVTADGVRDLAVSLEGAAEIGERLTEQIQTSGDGQRMANAASVCRWQLLILRERVLESKVDRRLTRVRTEIVLHLEGAASAARKLSSGYRLHSLDHICDGGEAFEQHLTALATCRSRLAL